MYRRGEQGHNLVTLKSGLRERECSVCLQGGSSESAAAQTSEGAVLARESLKISLGRGAVAHALTPAGA